jgi:hypothetical protein
MVFNTNLTPTPKNHYKTTTIAPFIKTWFSQQTLMQQRFSKLFHPKYWTFSPGENTKPKVLSTPHAPYAGK